MLEAVVSAATIAALVGLATIYNNGDSIRNRREAVLDSINDSADFLNSLEGDADADFLFMKELGFFDAGFDVPEEFQEDVAMYQEGGDGRAGGRKQIQFVVRCLKQVNCRTKALETVGGWGVNNRKYMEGNIAVLLHPIASKTMADGEGVIPVCTPYDDVWACSGEEAIAYVPTFNADAANTLSGHPNVDVDALSADSVAFANVIDGLGVNSVSDPKNIFGMGGGGVKIVLVIPNGVPIHMSENYQSNFGNYWKFFSKFNNRYIGINPKTGGTPSNRVNFHFWFLRQDKTAKAVMSNPVKANKRFPWDRFNNLMGKVQPTAAQPKLRGTFASIQSTIESKNFGTDTTEGRDCIVMWFHQYIPQDLLELADSYSQEEVIERLDSICTVIHFWVGMGAINGDSKMVVKYLQGLLQPKQKARTSSDYEMRSWHFVDHLTDLADENNDNLMAKVYNEISLERHRAKCLLMDSGSDVAKDIEKINEELSAKESQYDYFGDMTSEAPYDGTTAQMDNYAEAYGYDDPGLDYDQGADSDGSDAEASTETDYMCCGRGLSGKKFNTHTEECCDDGGVGILGDFECF